MVFARSIPPLIRSSGTTAQRCRCVSLLAGIAMLSACSWGETPPPHLRELAELPGWNPSDAGFTDAAAGLSKACGNVLAQDQSIGIGGEARDWQMPCHMLMQLATFDSPQYFDALRSAVNGFVAIDPGTG